MNSSQSDPGLAVILAPVVLLVIIFFVIFGRKRPDNSSRTASVAPATITHTVRPEEKAQPKRELSDMLPHQFIVLDLETTGLSTTADEIIEIAAVKVTINETQHPYIQTLVKPTCKIPRKITEITGITQSMVDADGVTLAAAMEKFLEFAGNLPLVTYNAEFDIGFLKSAAARCNVPFNNCYACALKRARRAFPFLPNHKLVRVAEAFKLPDNDQHRALSDCSRAAQVFMLATVELNQKVRWTQSQSK